jgi:amino acid permease
MTDADIHSTDFLLAPTLTLDHHLSMQIVGRFHAKANMISVIAMQRMKIPVLPSIVNAALITTVVSGGNAFAFNASRSLHALALEGQAPAFLRRTNSKYVTKSHGFCVSINDGY